LRFGLPAYLCFLSMLAWVTMTHVVLSLGHYGLLTLLAIPFIAFAVAWGHTLLSIHRTKNALQELVERQPTVESADAPVGDIVFGGLSSLRTGSQTQKGDPRDKPPFQFSIRAMLIVTAAVAVLAAGMSQATVAYWHFMMAGLVALSLLARGLEHRTLGNCLLIVLAVVLIGGHGAVDNESTRSGSLYGTHVGVVISGNAQFFPESALNDIDAWLKADGFQRCDSPPELSSHLSYFGPYTSKPDTTTWYTGVASDRQGIAVRVESAKNGADLQFVNMDYVSHASGFRREVEEHEKRCSQFVDKINHWWRGYYDAFQKKHGKS
jgi:hypothetical protein